MKRWIAVSWLVFLLIALQSLGIQTTESSISDTNLAIQASSDEPVVITSNADFEAQGWPGNGSKSNPFILDGLSFEISIAPAIRIEHTTSYFLLTKSLFLPEYLWDDGPGVSLHNVSNARITGCTVGETGGVGVSGFEVTNSSIIDCWFSGGTGILLERSSRCNISNNRITSGNGIGQYGVFLVNSSYISVSGNTILYKNYRGVALYGSNECTLVNNSIIGGNTCVAINSIERNLLYGNKIGWARYTLAIDYSSLTQWDDNVSQGNAWSDYNGTGVYSVSGSGQGVDRYPSKLTEDSFGPYIEHSFGYHTVDLIGPIDSFVMTAEVTDISGVDTVLLNISGDVYELIESETHPDIYRADVPFRRDLFHYYIWANDSLGNSLRTGLQGGYLYVYASYSSPSPPPARIDGLIIMGLGVGLVVAIVALVFVRSHREASMKLA